MAPKLMYLKYASRLVTFDLYVGRYIQVADIVLGCDEDEFVEHGDVIHYFLHDLYSIKLLTVCSYILQVIPSGEKPLRMKTLLNVVHLTLRTSLHDNEFWGIKLMLNCCPLLETLIIEIDSSKSRIL